MRDRGDAIETGSALDGGFAMIPSESDASHPPSKLKGRGPVKKISEVRTLRRAGRETAQASPISCVVNVEVDAARIVRDTYRFVFCLIVLLSGGGGVSLALYYAFLHLPK